MIGALQRVALREVWPHEAHDFSRWLDEHIDVLGDTIGLGLTSLQREHAAGAFSVDLLAEDEDGNGVVVENQLGRSDHDHLGKVLTYLAMTESSTAVWIVADPRPEHVSAVAWLNESSSASVYLVKVEAVRIGDSLPAPLFTLIVGPSVEIKEAARQKQESVERYAERREFWTDLLRIANARTRLHAAVTPSSGSGLRAGAGRSHHTFLYVALRGECFVAFDIASPDIEANRVAFEALVAVRGTVERAFGEPLTWDAVEGRKRHRIESPRLPFGYRDDWTDDQLAELVDAMVRLESAVSPHLAGLPS